MILDHDHETDRLAEDTRRLIAAGCDELPKTGPFRTAYQARCLAALDALIAELGSFHEPRRVIRGLRPENGDK